MRLHKSLNLGFNQFSKFFHSKNGRASFPNGTCRHFCVWCSCYSKVNLTKQALLILKVGTHKKARLGSGPYIWLLYDKCLIFKYITKLKVWHGQTCLSVLFTKLPQGRLRPRCSFSADIEYVSIGWIKRSESNFILLVINDWSFWWIRFA